VSLCGNLSLRAFSSTDWVEHVEESLCTVVTGGVV
jgi:hypothetical protein